MKQIFFLFLTLATTHGESEDADSRKTCTYSPGIGCLFRATIALRPDCILDCFSPPTPPPPPVSQQAPCSANKHETFILNTGDTNLRYTCGDGSTKTKIFYPTSDSPPPHEGYPVVMFHRGSSGYESKYADMNGTGYDAWLESVAKQCLIVIAPKTDGLPWIPLEETSEECKRDNDLIIAMKWARKNLTKHLGLPRSLKADWGSVGAMGHSAGAHHLPKFVEDANQSYVEDGETYQGVNIKATVFSHGGDDLYIDISNHSMGMYNTPWARTPSLFLTANKDDRKKHNHCTYPKCSYDLYKGMHAKNKVFANMKFGDHNEPHVLHQFAAWTGRFLACHLYHRKSGSMRRNDTCLRIYTKKGTPEICDESKHPFAAPVSTKDGNRMPGCEVSGQGPPLHS